MWFDHMKTVNSENSTGSSGKNVVMKTLQYVCEVTKMINHFSINNVPYEQPN